MRLSGSATAEYSSPGLEIIFRVRKILPMVLRHMRGYHDRVPLTAGLSWMDSHPVPVEEYFQCIARDTDADRFPDQIMIITVRWSRLSSKVRAIVPVLQSHFDFACLLWTY